MDETRLDKIEIKELEVFHSCRADRLRERGALVVEHYRCGGVERALAVGITQKRV